jgi:hypothetical protein
MVRSIIMLAACAALFSGCSGSDVGIGTGPRGWSHYGDGLWTNPRSKHDEYTAVNDRFEGTLQDLASQTTTKFVLGLKAKLGSAVPFPRCPAVAGLQTFSLSGGTVMQVAFSVQNGRMVQVEYIRPGKEPVDPAVTDAMAANVCVLP